MCSTRLCSFANNRRASGALSTFFGKAIAVVMSVALVGGQSAHAALVAGWDF